MGLAAHPSILSLAEWVRGNIHKRHGNGVLPECYTAACTCDFLESVLVSVPPCVRQTAIYTKSDGIVDWRVCLTGDPSIDVEVAATHIGLVFSPTVYDVLAQKLAISQENGSIHSEHCA